MLPKHSGVQFSKKSKQGGHDLFRNIKTCQCPRTSSGKVCNTDLHLGKISLSNAPTNRKCYSPYFSFKNGSTHNLEFLQMSNEIRLYLLANQITVTAEYFQSSPGMFRQIESPYKDSSN